MIAWWDRLCWQLQNGLLDMEIHPQVQGKMGQNLGRRGYQWQRPMCSQRSWSVSVVSAFEPRKDLRK
jgi:hypothetical protein